MKVTEHYDRATEPLISFEVIPPKRGSYVKGVFDAIDAVMRFKPPFIDVTSHAAEASYEELPDGTLRRQVKRKRPGTIGLCAAIKHRYGVDPVPHILCKGFTKEETEDALIELNYLGIENVLAVRGDHHAAFKPHNRGRGTNEYTTDLVRQIDQMNHGVYLETMLDAAATDFCIGVGGYPEKHFEAPNLDRDINHLKEKVEAGADYIVTQMFFDNAVYFRFVEKCREAGIHVPIIPGIKVLTSASQLTAIPKSFYVDIPEALAHAMSSQPDKARGIGIEWSRQQCRALLEGGVPGLHFYIMANPTAVIEVIDSM
jgi:methylenetetrahydrofolate reductase (NADPH)